MTHSVLRHFLPAFPLLTASPALAEEGGKAGLPQMDTSTYASQLFWLSVCFVVLYVLMSRLALPRVTKVLETRRIKVEGDLDDAQRLNDEAEKIKTAFEKKLAEAQKTGNSEMAKAEREISDWAAKEQATFSEKSRKQLSATELNINKAKADALQSISDVAADIAADIVSKIAGVQVSKAEAIKAVQSVTQKG